MKRLLLMMFAVFILSNSLVSVTYGQAANDLVVVPEGSQAADSVVMDLQNQ